MKISSFKFQGFRSAGGRRRAAAAGIFLLLLLGAGRLPLAVEAHGGVDDEKPAATPASGTAPGAGAAGVARAERNLQIDAGQFNIRLERAPSDIRAGETSQYAVSIAEKVEGGFGAGAPLAIEDAAVTASITAADGSGAVAENLPAKFEKGFYRGSYTFKNAGDFKIVFNVTTADGRNFPIDFPVTVVKGPINSLFWLGLAALGLLTIGTIAAAFLKTRRIEENSPRRRILWPVTAAALLIFALGAAALGFFAPPRQTRNPAEMPPVGTNAVAPETGVPTGLQTALVVPKESQVLFGIKTELVSTRQITSGLKTTGTVRARPDARAVVVPPVAGRIILREGLTLGSAVSRGEQIGSVEQILDVAGQVGLEQQRLEVEAQQRDVEAKRLEIKNTVLQLQAQQADQRAKAGQAKTQLAQANRELRRAANLVEIGAVPKKRLEEAQTAVKVSEQEVASNEQQVRLLDNQIKQTSAGQSIFRSPRVNQPTKTFPLTAPVTGIVGDIKATSGQQVEGITEILSIVNLSTVLIEAQVFESDLPAVRESTRASLTAAALSGEVYHIGTPDGDGRLVSIGQNVNEQTRTVPVIYELKNPSGRLRDGMFVDITVDTSGGAQVLAVPKNSVVSDQGQTFVFVLTGGENFEKRAVTLGAEGADFDEIKSGLKEGERVVTEGIYQLRLTIPS